MEFPMEVSSRLRKLIDYGTKVYLQVSQEMNLEIYDR